MNPTRKRGLIIALGCYLIWGLLPIYWKLLSAVPSSEVQGQRMVWACVFVVGFCLVTKQHFAGLLKERRAVKTFALTAVFITINWSTYIYTVNSGHIVESAMGYYINPLLTILIGVFFFHEKLTKGQTIATVLAIIGVAYFAISYGRFPILGIFLAVSWALYASVKKWGGYPSAQGLAVESLFVGALGLVCVIASLFVPTLWTMLTPNVTPGPIAVYDARLIMVLFVLSGVLTWIPLQLFAEATNTIPMVWISFCQYLSPTIALCVGVFLFGESFTPAHFVLFGCLWAGIAAIAVEAIIHSRHSKRETASD